MVGGKTLYTAEEDQFIIKHGNRDMSFPDIGRHLGGRTRNQVRGRWLELMDKAVRRDPDPEVTPAQVDDALEELVAAPAPKFSDAQRTSVERLFDGGWTVKKIAEHTGLSTKYVQEITAGMDPSRRLEVLHDPDIIKHLEARNLSLTKDITRVSQERDRLRDFVEEIKTEIVALPVPKKLAVPDVSWKKGTRPLIPVAMASDWHGEETIDKEAMEGMNEFNFTIFQERVWHWVDRVIRLCTLRSAEAPIPELHVDFLGDILTGEIHEELTWTNQMRTPKALVRIGMIMGQALMAFTAAFDRVVATGIAGNHGRNAEKYHFKQFAENNFDVSIYEIASLYCRSAIESGRLTFNVARSPKITVNRFDMTFLLTHGGDIKCFNGISYYGVEKHNAREHAMRKAQPGQVLDARDFDYVEMGHWHAANKIGNTIMNGSVSGPTEMTMNRFSDNKPPEQVLFFVDEKIGIRALESIPLWFADGHGHQFTMDPIRG